MPAEQPVRDGPSTTSAGAVAAALAATTITVLPTFLTGALAVQITADLRLTPTALGAAVGCFFAASAIGSIPLGRVAERLEWRRSLRLAVGLSAASLAAIGIGAADWATLSLLLAAAGIAQALANPAANLALARAVRPGRLGIMFGAKQAAVPMATLAGGAAVPLIALTVGWRWAYLVGAVAAIVLALSLRRLREPPRSSARPAALIHAPLGALAVLAVGGGIGAGVAVALGGFVVLAAVEAGLTPGDAAALLVAGGIGAALLRLLYGWLADHRLRHPLRGVSLSMLGGAGGFLLLSSGQPAVLVIGALVTFALGWGWNGLFHYAVVVRNVEAPAAASGVTQSGFFVGSALIPPLFGLAVDHLTFAAAWAACAALSVVAAVLVEVGRRAMGDRPER